MKSGLTVQKLGSGLRRISEVSGDGARWVGGDGGSAPTERGWAKQGTGQTELAEAKQGSAPTERGWARQGEGEMRMGGVRQGEGDGHAAKGV